MQVRILLGSPTAYADAIRVSCSFGFVPTTNSVLEGVASFWDFGTFAGRWHSSCTSWSAQCPSADWSARSARSTRPPEEFAHAIDRVDSDTGRISARRSPGYEDERTRLATAVQAEGCSGGKFDLDEGDQQFEVDDAVCADGRKYDLKFDMQMQLKRKNLD
ncbi:hypothetical protein GWE18_16610 [Bradyrhizobium sp. CSA112]|uniref:hypothetical protein n=1 Tax=Bradyrhizobium sp. CSA112 TaxID=2699170 RepID=UPI0023B12B37|nr:hypothetical protein [Bradyrhizobium sp. CSA112]MDE5454432.1 hypothetical protein [Bradyrhizobium sp. CSA112]